MPDPNKPQSPSDIEYERRAQELDKATKAHFDNWDQDVAKAANPYAAAAPYSFNSRSTDDTNKNFERYYSHSSYDKLGFNPWRDNETLYNEQGSKLGDVSRAIKSAGKLAVTGFVSPLRSYADLFTGNALSGDYESAEEMKYQNAVGSSSRGGVTGFASNLITNSGYTVGLMGEMALETFALAATGGIGAPLELARIGKGIKDLGNLGRDVQGINEGVQGLKNFTTAKNFWESTKNVGKAVVNFVNPINNTVKAYKGAEGLDALAKASETAGGFYRDVQMANLTLSEAKLEGASTEKDTEEELINRYRARNNGSQPTGDDLLSIKDAASDAGDTALAWNIPTIFLTNKITFEPLLKSFTKPSSFALKNGLEVIDAGKKGIVEATFKNKFVASLKPKNLLKAPLTYFKENLSEGLQETAQEIISGSAKDYYESLYISAAKQGLDYGHAENKGDNVWDVISKNVTDQFSGKGFETFASGFLMGGLIKPFAASTSALRDLTKSKEYKAQKAAYASATLEKLNEINSNPLTLFGSGIINFANGAEAVKGQTISEEEGKQKNWQDFEDQNVISNALTALDNNSYGLFQDKLNNIKSMTPEAITEAYGLNGQEVLSKIDSILTRADKVKENYDKWNERYKNPFNPSQFEKGNTGYTKEAIGFATWENAKKLAIFNESAFQRNAERIQSITRDITQTEGLDKIAATDVSLLLTPKTINSELSLLNSEISVLEDSGADRSELAVKKSKRAKLEDFSDKLRGYYLGQIDPSKENVSKLQLKKSYQNYLKHLAVSQTNVIPLSDLNVDSSFQQLLDIHDLNQDNIQHVDAINVLANPNGFVDQYKRLNKVFTDIYNNREELNKQAVENTQTKIEDNAILNVLFERGFVLSPDNVEKLLKNKQVPDEFYDQNAKQVVDRRDPFRFKEFDDIVTNYTEATKPEPTEAELLGERINKFVDNIVAGVEQNSEEEIEFYNNNKDAVEAELQKRKPVENVVDPVVEVPVGEDVLAKFAAIKNEEQLSELEVELSSLIQSTTTSEQENMGLSFRQIDELIQEKRQELAKNVTLDNLNVGNIILMQSGKKGEIIKKGRTDVKIRDLENPSLVITVQEGNLKNTIKLKYSESMKSEEIKPTADELSKAKENAEKVEKNVINDKELLTNILNEAMQDEAKYNEEFINNLGCK